MVLVELLFASNVKNDHTKDIMVLLLAAYIFIETKGQIFFIAWPPSGSFDVPYQLLQQFEQWKLVL